MTSTYDAAHATHIAARLLGVPLTASPEEVTRAFRLFAELTHPDKNPGNPDAPLEFQRIRFASDILTAYRNNQPLDPYKVRVMLAVPAPAPNPKVVKAYSTPTARVTTLDVRM